jgi:hypothetical protein
VELAVLGAARAAALVLAAGEAATAAAEPRGRTMKTL